MINLQEAAYVICLLASIYLAFRAGNNFNSGSIGRFFLNVGGMVALLIVGVIIAPTDKLRMIVLFFCFLLLLVMLLGKIKATRLDLLNTRKPTTDN